MGVSCPRFLALLLLFAKPFSEDVLRKWPSPDQESETPGLLRTLVLLYIAKIFASVYYVDNPYLGITFADIVCNCNW